MAVDLNLEVSICLWSLFLILFFFLVAWLSRDWSVGGISPLRFGVHASDVAFLPIPFCNGYDTWRCLLETRAADSEAK